MQLSQALFATAREHVDDLLRNGDTFDDADAGGCGSHSWSAAAPDDGVGAPLWQECCVASPVSGL